MKKLNIIIMTFLIIISLFLLYNAVTIPDMESGYYSIFLDNINDKIFYFLLIIFILGVTIVLYSLLIYKEIRKKQDSDIITNILMVTIIALQFYSVLYQILILSNKYNHLIRYHYMIMNNYFQVISYITLGLGIVLFLYYQFIPNKVKIRLHRPYIYGGGLLVLLSVGLAVGINQSQRKIPLHLGDDVTINIDSSANGYAYASLELNDNFYKQFDDSGIFSGSGIKEKTLMLNIDIIDGQSSELKNGDKFSYKITFNENIKSSFEIYDEDEVYTYKVKGLVSYYYKKEEIASQYEQLKSTAMEEIESISKRYSSYEYYGSELSYTNYSDYRNDGKSKITFYFIVSDKVAKPERYIVTTVSFSGCDQALKDLEFHVNLDEAGEPYDMNVYETEEEARQSIEADIKSNLYSHDRIE